MLKLRIKKNNITKKFNTTDNKELVNIPYLQFKENPKEYYSNLKVSEDNKWIIRMNNKTYNIINGTLVEDTTEHIMGIVLTDEGNPDSWVRINKNLEPINFDSNNLIWKNMQIIEDSNLGELAEIPIVYTKTEEFSAGPYEGKVCYWISDYPATGFHVHPAFINENGIPGKIRMATNWNTYDFNDEDYWTDKWYPNNIRKYSIYDHHLLARLMLIEFGHPNVAPIIGIPDPNDEWEPIDHNYHGIHYVFGRGQYEQCLLRGIEIDTDVNAPIKIRLWKTDGSLEYVDTGLSLPFENPDRDAYLYPSRCHISKVKGIDMGDVFLNKVPVRDDSTAHDDEYRMAHNSFYAYQGFNSSTLYVNAYSSLYANAFSISPGGDCDEINRLIQVVTA